MTGLTLDQFKEIVEFAQTYHMFGRYYDDIERAGITTLYPKWKNLEIKYIYCSMIAKYGTVSLITFGSKGGDKEFHFHIWEYEKPMPTYFDWIMAYLKGGEE